LRFAFFEAARYRACASGTTGDVALTDRGGPRSASAIARSLKKIDRRYSESPCLVTFFALYTVLLVMSHFSIESAAMSKPPTFLRGLAGSAVPLAAAILVASIAGLLVYIFWFGTDWIMEWLF